MPSRHRSNSGNGNKNPTSSQPNPNPNNNKSQQQLQTKLDKAATLEAKLSTVPPNNASKEDETTASQLRIQLCEIFSDLLLTDPTLSARKDVCGRLWRSCFYVRIGELRGRIAKEKSRFRKLQKRGGGGEEKSVEEKGGGDLVQQGKCVKTYEDRLKVFIREAVVLYEYLVDQFQEILLPNPTQASQTSGNGNSQSQQSGGEDAANSNERAGVVPTLHRLYIYLGDLHRYTCSYPLADAAYLKASCLAPGKGNPYNQLAVVAQLKDSSGAHPLPAVALYWYCRSLLAVHDAFETSRSNVERLFTANRKWIAQKLDGDTGSEDMDISTEGTSREKGRAMRSAASRKFLSLFCNFHGSLFSDVVQDGMSRKKMYEKMEKDKDYLIRQFNMLLIESAFGDALLLKMVSINAFSVWNGLSPGTSSPSSLNEPNSPQTVVAVSFALEYGAQLASITEVLFEKMESKRQQQQGGGTKNGTGIRLIGPLLMLCDFISYMFKRNQEMSELCKSISGAAHNDDARNMFFKSQRIFWASITKLALFLKSSHYVSSLLKIEDGDPKVTLPIDFKPMTRGYAPFAFFEHGEAEFEDSSLKPISSHAKQNKTQTGTDAYLTFEEAANALELYPARGSSQSSQRSKKSSQVDLKGTSQMEVQTRLKLKKFMLFISRHRKSGEIFETDKQEEISVGVASNQKETAESDFSPEGADMDWDSQTKEDINNNKLNSGMLPDKPEEDIIVYKETGNGPALLVPGAFLVSSSEKKEKKQKMFCGPPTPAATPRKSASTSGLLDLSTLLNQTVNDSDSYPANNPSDLAAALKNCSSLNNVATYSNNVPVVPPMPQSSSPNSAPKMQAGSVLRPPPGFNSTAQPLKSNLPNVHHMSAPCLLGNTGIQSTYPNNFETPHQSYTGERSYNENYITDPNTPTLMYQFPSDIFSDLAQPHIIPQTNNPFAYPMPPLGSTDKRFQGLNVPSHLPNGLVLNPAPLLGTRNEVSYLGANLAQNSVHANDTSTDLNMELGNDLFGLRSLGLLDDSAATKNPFAYE